jgi:hypothetical protein
MRVGSFFAPAAAETAADALGEKARMASRSGRPMIAPAAPRSMVRREMGLGITYSRFVGPAVRDVFAWSRRNVPHSGTYG